MVKSEGFTPDFDKMIEIVLERHGFFTVLMAYVSMQILHTTCSLGITFSTVGGVISGRLPGVCGSNRKAVLAGSTAKHLLHSDLHCNLHKNYYLMLVGSR